MPAQPQSTFAAPSTRAWLQPLLTPWVRRAALVGFLASFVFPTAGLGVDLCPLHRVTGLPCPGCGVTRALALVSQGDLALALGLNPFVLVLWPGLVLWACLALLPQRTVVGLERKLDMLEPGLSAAWRVLLLAFLGFGVLRFAALLALGERFP